MKLLKCILPICLALFACSTDTIAVDSEQDEIPSSGENSSTAQNLFSEEFLSAIDSNGYYTTRDSVAAYLCKYGKLPGNYRTKSETQALYEATGETFSKWNFNPWKVLGVMVGGDTFSNAEGILPSNSYKEGDVDYSGDNRGTKRLIYAESCTIYYTADHYTSFVQLE